MSYKVKYFPDGSSYVDVEEFESNEIIKINSYNDLWTLAQLNDVYKRNKVALHVTIPCLLDAQADKVFDKRQSYNLKLVCNFINDLKLDRIEIFHPHNQEVVEALIDNVEIISNERYISKLFYSDKGWYKGNDTIVLSPDAGAYKWIAKTLNNIGYKGELYCGSKTRDKEAFPIIERQDFKGQDVVIIDDILIYGGTLIKVAQLLKTKNCGKLYAIVSHTTVKNPREDLGAYFEAVYTTNSKYNEYENKIIKVIPMFHGI